MKPFLRTVASKSASMMTSASLKPFFQTKLFNAIRLNRTEFSPAFSSNDFRFLAYCAARRPNSHSQILQDLWVCFELGEKKSGFFVEFGATNGLTNSNTYLLENDYAWTGILAEPNPFWHADLKNNRHDDFDRRCVSSSSGDYVDFLTTDDTDPELSGIAEFAGSDHFADIRSSANCIKIKTVSLDDLLVENNAPKHIDYISLDTEGSELSILESFSFSYTFSLISIEQNEITGPKIEALLGEHGYKRVFSQFSQWDGWYVCGDLQNRPIKTIVAPAS